MVETLLTCVYK